jgi:predicted RNase H-like HicB family nuclease
MGVCHDFPSCISAGETIEEAQVMATEALNGRIDLTVEDGDSIPNPSPLEIIISDDDHKDATAFLGSTN